MTVHKGSRLLTAVLFILALLVQHAYSFSNWGDPFYPVTKKENGGPEWPDRGLPQKLHTDMMAVSYDFPLGRAPKSQLPCQVDVKLMYHWEEHGAWRNRVRFRLPRSDIDRQTVKQSITAAWFLNLERTRFVTVDRCWTESINWRLWEDPNNRDWYVDFSANKVPQQAVTQAACQAAYFKKMMGQFYGCDWK